MKKVVVTRALPEKELKRLKEKYCVEVNPFDRDYTKEELKEAIKEADAVLCMLSNAIDQSVFENAPGVKIFANYAVGYNNIDIKTAKDRNVYVSNTPGVLTEATADLTWALILSVARRVLEGDQCVRTGNFKGWEPRLLLGKDLNGSTLGLIGAGRIGCAVAKRASGFGMKVIYHNRKPSVEMDQLGATFCDLETALKESDVLSLHAPLTAETHHMINEEAIKKMKSSAILINTARGPVVDEKALAKALKEGRLWGAGFDVYEEEPTVEPELLSLKNVVLLPHLGSAAEQTRDEMVRIAVENIISVLEGRNPVTPVY